MSRHYCLSRLLLLQQLLYLTFALVSSSKNAAVVGGNSNNNHAVVNHKWILTQHPQKNQNFQASQNARLVKDDVLDMVALQNDDDKIVVQVETLGVDAFLRTILDDSANAVHGSLPVGATLPAMGCGTVLSCPSNAKGCKLRPGDHVIGLLCAQSYAVFPASQSSRLERIPKRWLPMSSAATLTWWGVSGLTAYIGIHHVLGSPKRGQTVVVSAAAGGTGSLVAQLAQRTGARVVGIAGGPQKQAWLLETLQLDGAVDYQHPTKSLNEQFEETCPNGIDFYFDNVGGPLLDTILARINQNARIVICGAVSQYSQINHGPIYGPSNYIKLAERSATMAGFVLSHYRKHWRMARLRLLYHVAVRGTVKSYEQVETGIESFGPALEKLYEGGNTGKLLVDLKATTEDSL
jgi:NADPH-dependent curcumin reductase CurA